MRDNHGGYTEEQNSYWIGESEIVKHLKGPKKKKVGYSRFTLHFEDLK
ncbi:MAG: hypothetical protein MJE68_32415 [Proteobacteria bacterium]|nr:hypothetical protein [Pseudomonadota bacterium]